MLALTRFAMNTNTLAGTLEEKLRAVKGAGFGAIVLSGADLVGHRDGVEEAVELVIGSGLRVLAFQMLHDFEGLSGHMLDYKLDNHANVGLAIDSFHVLARGTSRESFDAIPGEKIFLVQLSDYLWDLDDLIETARHRRVFPSEGNHNVAIVDLVGRLERAGYRGDYSFDVVNDDYAHLPAAAVAARGRKAATSLCAQ